MRNAVTVRLCVEILIAAQCTNTTCITCHSLFLILLHYCSSCVESFKILGYENDHDGSHLFNNN